MIEFLEHDDNEISITKFLDDNWNRPLKSDDRQQFKRDTNWGASLDEDKDKEHKWDNHFQHSGHSHAVDNDEEESESEEEDDEEANGILSNDQSIEKNAKKRGKKKKKNKSKKPFGGTNEDVVFVEFNLEHQPHRSEYDYWLQ